MDIVAFHPGISPHISEVFIMKKFLTQFASNESGATAIEYGLIAALIAVALIAILGTLSTSLSGTFQKVATKLDAANT